MRTIRRLGLVLALVFVGLLSLAGCERLNATPAEHMATARQHLDDGELRPALIELLNALQKAPDMLEARWLLAQVALKLGDGARAEKEANRAIALGLPRGEAQPTLVKAIYLQGDLDRVLAESTPLALGMPEADQASVLGLRGHALIRKERLEHAEQTLNRALKLDKQSTAALIGMAMLYGVRQDYQQARHWLELALAADPGSAEAWSVLGDMELATGNLEKAEAAFTKAIELREYPSLDRAKRALVRLQLGEYEAAEADIEALKKQGFGDHPYVSYVVGLNLFRQEDYESALTAFRLSTQAAPSFLPAAVYLATTELILGHLEQALAAAESVYFRAPDSMAAARLLGAVQIGRSDYAAAANVLQAALKDSPDNLEVLSMLATVSLLQGRTEQGVEYARRVMALDPESEQAKSMLMLANLMGGQSLGEEAADIGARTPTEDDDYLRDFLRAAEAFRDGDIEQALARAQALHEQYPDRVDPLKLIAASYLALGQWDEAKAKLEQVLEMSPQEPSATRNLARVEMRQGNLERARTLLRPLLKENPGDAESALLLAEIAALLGDQARAMRVLERALDSNPGTLSVRAKLADAYLAANRIEDVLAVTRGLTPEQLRQQPELLEARGRALMLAGDPQAAQRTFERWTELAPDSALAHYLYGDALARTGAIARAQEELQQAIKLAPDYLPARVAQVKMLVHLGELEAAREALTELRGDFGAQPEVLGIEGWFAMGTGDFATAAERFSAALEQRPSSELVIRLVRALWAQEKYDRAITVMNEWLADHPRDLAVLLHLAGGYLTLERPAQAREIYAKVVEHYPDHVVALNNLAWLSREGKLEDAITYARTAQRLAPNDPQVLDTLGMLLLRRGDVEAGYRRIREAAEHAPEDLTIQLHLARALARTERFPEAREILDAVIERAPDSQLARDAKAIMAELPSAEG